MRLGARQIADLGVHDLLRNRPDGLADHVGVLIAQHLPNDLEGRHLSWPALAGLL